MLASLATAILASPCLQALPSHTNQILDQAQDTTKTNQPTVEKIHLHKRGNSQLEAAGIRGSVNGSHTIEYLIEAKTGQFLELDLRSNHALASYQITAPAAPRALHKGQGPHSRYTVTLPRDGTYRVLVYLMEAAAQNGEQAEFILNIRVRNPG